MLGYAVLYVLSEDSCGLGLAKQDQDGLFVIRCDAKTRRDSKGLRSYEKTKTIMAVAVRYEFSTCFAI